MDILPKNYSDFLSKKYWDSFFRKLERKSLDSEFFEWYGDFSAIFPYFSQKIAKNSRILNIGCGNSLFSEELYDHGYKNVKNIDFSEKTIKKMRKRSKNRPEMTYEVQDIFAMKYENASFDVIVDKGTLDAVFPEESAANLERVRGLFAKILEILPENGVYLVVSLLQSHIFQAILEFFRDFSVEIHELLVKDSKMFPFLLEIRKKKRENGLIFADFKGKDEKAGFFEEKVCVEAVKRLQMRNNFAKNAKKLSPGQRFTLDLWENQANVSNLPSSLPKYTLIVVDSEQKAVLNKNTCGCFITPQGKENAYLFARDKGNFELLEQTQLSRLIIALLSPGFAFSSLKSVQMELTPVIQALIPDNCANSPVPYLTDGDELGERLVIFQSSGLLIEETRNDEENVFRRLIFTRNLSQIQSQFRVIYKENALKPQGFKQFPSLLQEKPGVFAGIDRSFLDFECHKLMVVGLSLMNCEFFQQKVKRIAVLGGGLCALSGFLAEHFQGFRVETVEIDKEIVQIARDLFELQENCEDFQVICADARDFIRKKSESFTEIAGNPEKSEKPHVNPEKSQGNQGDPDKPQGNPEKPQGNPEKSQGNPEKPQGNPEKPQGNQDFYDVIIVDINSDDCEECSPPSKFQSLEFLKEIQRCLRPSGMFFVNFIAKDEKTFQAFLQEISKLFHLIYSAKAEDEYNTVIYAKNLQFPEESKKNSSEEEEKIIVVEENAVLSKKTIEQNFKTLVKSLKKSWDHTLNLEQLLGNLVLQRPNLNKNPFEKKSAHFVDVNANLTNNTKEMYIKDLEKVNKSKKKRKNKKR